MLMIANDPEIGGSRERSQYRAGRKYGRFMQPDPIGYQAGTNLYSYAGGDPVNAADPSGLTPQAVICTGTRLGCPVHHDSGGSGLNPASSGTSDHVGQTNWAAVKRDPNPVPFTGTGTLTTYSDGTQALTSATITFGGRFQGLTVSGNPAVAFVMSAAPGQTYLRASPTDSEGYTDISAFTIQRGLGAKINETVVTDLSQVKLITRFTTVVQCNRCVGPLFGGSYDVRFLDPARRQVGGTESVVGRIGIAGVTKMDVPSGAYFMRFVPTILTPRSTQVLVRGIRQRGW